MKPATTTSHKANAEEMAALLRMLGHPQRLLMLCRLDEGEASVGELVELTGLSQSSVSQHLATLREQGLVGARSQAQSRLYRIVDGKLSAMIRALCQICGKPVA
jgi:DNA-binding transcriptional ArsR family regulator